MKIEIIVAKEKIKMPELESMIEKKLIEQLIYLRPFAHLYLEWLQRYFRQALYWGYSLCYPLQVIYGDSQWVYREDLKSENDLWANFKYILEQNNKDRLNGVTVLPAASDLYWLSIRGVPSRWQRNVKSKTSYVFLISSQPSWMQPSMPIISEVFDKLQNIETGLYMQSPAYVYDLFKDEMNFGPILSSATGPMTISYLLSWLHNSFLISQKKRFLLFITNITHSSVVRSPYERTKKDD